MEPVQGLQVFGLFRLLNGEEHRCDHIKKVERRIVVRVVNGKCWKALVRIMQVPGTCDVRGMLSHAALSAALMGALASQQLHAILHTQNVQVILEMNRISTQTTLSMSSFLVFNSSVHAGDTCTLLFTFHSTSGLPV